MATRKKDPAKKARKPAPQPKRGTKKVAKAKGKKPTVPAAKQRQASAKALQGAARTTVQSIDLGHYAGTYGGYRPDPPPSRWTRFRSAITGLFVSLGFAKKHPDTTVRETR